MGDVRRRGRPPKLSDADVAAIVAARAAGVPWKLLMRRFDMSRAQLADAYRRATGRISGHLSRISGHPQRGRAA